MDIKMSTKGKTKRKRKISADMDLYKGKLSFKEKIFYSFGELGQNLSLQMVVVFSTIYLTDVALIPAVTLGTVVLILRAFDAFTDVFAGITVDNSSFKFARKWKNGNKFRPLLLVYTPISAILFILLFSIPSNVSITMKLIWYISVSIINGFFFSVVNIGAMGLMTRITQNPKERNAVSAIMGIFVMLSVIIVSSLVPMINKMVGNESLGLKVSAIIFSLLFVLFTYVQVFYSKERIQDTIDNENIENVNNKKKKKYTLKEGIKIIFTNKALMAFFLSGVCSTIATSVLQGGNIYYLKYYMYDYNLSKLGLLTALGGITIFPSIILTPYLANKIGKKNIYSIALLLMSILSFVKIIIPQGNIKMLIALTPFTGIGTGIFLSLAASLGSDIQEYSEWKYGKRTEGITSSVTAALKKIMTSFSTAIPLFVLGLSGYVANQKQQPSSVLNGILAINIVIPAILFFIAALVLHFMFPLDKKTLNTMLNDLKVRREK